MAKLIKAAGPIQLRDPADDAFAALVRSIMYQQLAGAAATAIHGRFLKLFADGLSPAAVLALEDGAMRSAGVSGAKAAAITDLSRKVADRTVPLDDVDSLSDDDLVARLVQVRGIGRWTAEMFLMFRLHRPDVLPAGDLGIVNAIQRLYRLRKRPDAKRVLKIGEAWKPYRSVASWYLWQTLRNEPLAKAAGTRRQSPQTSRAR